ncbi:ExbD/TolR family protein [Nitrospirota bacterium]
MDNNEFSSINVVPLVDVMLVLLVIVLTTSSFIALGAIPIELPKASSRAEKSISKAITIEINKQGRIYLNSKIVSPGLMKTTLKDMNRTTPVLIRADSGLPLQLFVDVMDTVKTLGFNKLSLQTEQKR